MTLRVAVVGLGHGAGYMKLASEHPRTTLAGVADQDKRRLEQAAEAHGVPTFESWDALFAAGIADAVAIALPTPLHRASTTAALEAGLHVLQEKPLCITGEDARAIGDAVARSGKIFQVGYEVRSSPLHQSILQHARRGDLGEVVSVWYNQHCEQHADPTEWRHSRTNMGGKLFDCAVHYLDLIQQWAGAPVERLVALGNLLGTTGPNADELPDTAAISLEYANGVRGTFNFSGVTRVYDDASFGLVGTTGRIMGNPWYPEGAGSYELRLDRGVRKSQVVFDGRLTSRGHLGWTEQFDTFVATVLDGAPNACSFDDALAVHRMMVAIDRSLATGEVINLNEVDL